MDPATPPLVCDLSRLSAAQREQLEALTGRLFPLADTFGDLPHGYALGYTDATAELLADIAVFIALDRVCCAFLRHELIVDPGPGTTWLKLTGGPGAKQAITDDIRALVPEALERLAGSASPAAR